MPLVLIVSGVGTHTHKDAYVLTFWAKEIGTLAKMTG